MAAVDPVEVRTFLEAEAGTSAAETTTIEAASARLGISRSLGFQLAREGRFPVPVIRAGRRLLVPTRALDHVLLVIEPKSDPLSAQVA